MDYPYLPPGREILYVPLENPYMQVAKDSAERFSSDKAHRTGAVIVKDGEIISYGANYSWFHRWLLCVRKLFNAPSGQYYGCCPGCSPAHHAEAQAICQAKKKSADPGSESGTSLLEGADLYLWGHWWCCQGCWARMIEAGVANVYLIEGAKEQFRK